MPTPPFSFIVVAAGMKLDQALQAVRLKGLMAHTQGHASIVIGLIDGPVEHDHPALAAGNLRVLGSAAGCKRGDSMACAHGTFVAGILHARRGGAAPGLCPASPLLSRPIFDEAGGGFPSCDAEELAAAIVDCLAAGARLLNLSVGVLRASPAGERALTEALDSAARRGTLVVAAAGNQGAVGGSVLIRHPAVISVVAADDSGRVANLSNVGMSIGRGGFAAPGDDIESLAPQGRTRRFSGTSVAAPFVTGAAALLWATRPAAPAARIRQALLASRGNSSSKRNSGGTRRTSIVPPMLDVQAAWDVLRQT